MITGARHGDHTRSAATAPARHGEPTSRRAHPILGSIGRTTDVVSIGSAGLCRTSRRVRHRETVQTSARPLPRRQGILRGFDSHVGAEESIASRSGHRSSPPTAPRRAWRSTRTSRSWPIRLTTRSSGHRRGRRFRDWPRARRPANRVGHTRESVGDPRDPHGPRPANGHSGTRRRRLMPRRLPPRFPPGHQMGR